jgi:8-oxo-dGTP pyrophosphatase MutT (NUDIX family)
MSLLDRVRYCQQRDLSRYRRFHAGGEPVGWVRHDLAEHIAGAEGFVVVPDAVTLAPHRDDFDGRSAAMRNLLRRLEREGIVTGWRDEDYAVASAYGRPPLLRMERAGVPCFGVQGLGVHLNGFVGEGDDLRLWVGRRSPTKQTSPNKLDHLVAGGQPYGLGLFENVLKECQEEAGIPRALAARARPAGLVAYLCEHEGGLRNDLLFCYDLALPESFVPVNTDGEISEFQLWPIDRVIAELAAGDAFKFNVALVIIDFLIRRGHVGPEEPDYLALVEGLRYPPVLGAGE